MMFSDVQSLTTATLDPKREARLDRSQPMSDVIFVHELYTLLDFRDPIRHI